MFYPTKKLFDRYTMMISNKAFSLIERANKINHEMKRKFLPSPNTL